MLYMIGIVLMVAGLGIHAFYPSVFFGYLLMAGALLYTVSQAMVSRQAPDLRSRRLRSMAFLAGILFLAGGYLFIVDRSYWRVVLTIASVLLLYSNVTLLYHKSRQESR